jgi:hypothetical protein
MSDLSLLWTILSVIGSVIGSVAVAAWWLKGQFTGAELAGVRAENAAHMVWRQYAEAQAKQLAEQLAEAKATIATLQTQIAEGATKEVLADTAASSSRAVERADEVAKRFSAYGDFINRTPPWETFRPPTEPPEKPKGGLLDLMSEQPPKRGLLDLMSEQPPKRGGLLD